jgi:hypothetical protein
MSKTYQYRSYIRWGQYIFFVFILLAIFVGVNFGIATYNLRLAFNPSSQISILDILMMSSCGLLLITEATVFWYIFYRMAGIKVILNEDSVIYKHRSGEKKIDFEKVTKIKLPSIPYMGGWIMIMAGKDKIRLTVALSEIDNFVLNLKASLDKLGLASRYDESKLFRFFKTAISSEQNFERLYSNFWKLLLTTIVSGLLGFGITKMSGVHEPLLVYLFFIYPVLGYSATEIPFNVRIAKSSIRESFFVPPRNITYEKSVYKVTLIVGIVIYFIIALTMIFSLK